MSLLVPHFTWRVTSSRSRYNGLPFLDNQHESGTQLFSRVQLRQILSLHMRRQDYDAPCPLLSLTGSLLWALNYARWLAQRGHQNVRLHLIDTSSISDDRVYSAKYLAKYTAVDPLGVPWHDDPYHEYIAFGGIPEPAVLGSVEIFADTTMSGLIPGFDTNVQGERLLASLERFQTPWATSVFGSSNAAVDVTAADVETARGAARELLLGENQTTHLVVSIMFLCLQKRSWTKEAFDALRSMFHDQCQPACGDNAGF